jgi:hypothetical protein
MAKSVPDPIFPDGVWDGTTDKWPEIVTDKTPDTEFAARYRAEIIALEEVLDSYIDLLQTISEYGAANTVLGVKNDGTELEYKILTAGPGIAITHDNAKIAFTSEDSEVLIIERLTNDNAGTIVIGQPVYVKSNGNIDLAQADDANTAQVIGLVFDDAIPSTGLGAVAVGGALTATTAEWDIVAGTTGGLTPGAIYYLSVAGKLTETPPSSIGEYVTQVGYAISPTVLIIEIEPISLRSVNTPVGFLALEDVTSGQYNTGIGYNTGRGITTGDYNTIIGAQVTGLIPGLSNYVIIADGQGNQRLVIDNNGHVYISTDNTKLLVGLGNDGEF